MGWEDRDYNREGFEGGRPSNPLWGLLFGSVPLGTWFGIRVRMHVSMIVLIAVTLLFAETGGGMGARNAFTSMSILFVSVLLHEFGHCFGAKWMGGEADEILMWPLGGLAQVRPPHRPWPSFVTTACGPLVNLLICILTGIPLGLYGVLPWFPLRSDLLRHIPPDWIFYIWWVFLVNYGLFTFNLMLVFYPFDGGRMIQEILWAIIGYYRSMMIATVVGMIGAVFVAGFAIAFQMFWLFFIAAFGFYACFRQRQFLRETGPEHWTDGPDYSASLRPERRRGGWSRRRAVRRIQKEAQRDQLAQARIDAILEKVSQHGMHSLTWSEKRALRKATERQRKREVEMTRRGF